MNYPLNKYRFYRAGKTGNKVVAVTTYAKKPVRASAICDATDTFDLDTGKMLAALRCNEKVAAKRLGRANVKFNDAKAKVKEAQDYLAKMHEYYNDAIIGYNEAAIEVDEFTKKLGKKD